MRMQLLYFCSDYAIGLTQAQTEQVENLSKEKSIDLFCISSEKEQETGLHQRIKNIGVNMIIVSGLDEHKNFKYLAQQIKQIIEINNITHVNVQNNWQLGLLAYLKMTTSLKFKLIYTIHGYRHNNPFKSLIAIAAIGSVLKLFTNRVISMSSYVSRRFPMVKSKTDIVYYMMKGKQYEQPLSPVDGIPLRMVFPAQFRHGKRQDMLIRAVKLYIDKTGDTSIQLYLPGSGPLRNEMIRLTKDLGIEKNVIFPGQLKLAEVADLYLKTNIALCSSNVETYGRCIAEPFMLGRCVITQKTGVAEDIIKDGENGLFFSNAENLTAHLIDLHLHPEKVTLMSKNALNDREIFLPDRVMNSYLNSLAKA